MKALPILDPKAAAIDVGSEKLHVSVAGDLPKVFGTFTGDLENLCVWFKEQGGLPVAGHLACARIITRGLCAAGGHPAVTRLPAAAGRPSHRGGQPDPEDATDTGTHEHQVSRRHQ